jgi:predicted Zn-dependent protease
VVSLLVTTAAPAQRGGAFSAQATDLVSRLARKHQVLKSLRCQLVTESAVPGGWATTRQELHFLAPDRFKLVTLSDDDPLAEKTVSLSFGQESYFVPEQTPLVRRWQRNLFLDWGAMAGGPANVAGFGADFDSLKAQYGGKVLGRDTVLDRETVRLILTANDPGMALAKDLVSTESTKYWTQFAVFKVPTYQRPPEVRLSVDQERGTVLRREHYRNGRLVLSATATETKELSPGLFFPTRFEVRDARGALVERVSYEGLELNPSVDESLFVLKHDTRAVTEDVELEKVSAYRDRTGKAPDDVSAGYNLVLALLRHEQDYTAALEGLERLAQTAPDALVPQVEHARLLALVGRPEDAVARYEAVLRKDPKFPLALEFSRVLLDTGRADAAAEALRGAEALHASSELLTELALAELRLGKPEEAAQHLVEAVKLPGAMNAAGRVPAAQGLLSLSRWRFDAAWLQAQVAALPECSGKSFVQGDAALTAGQVNEALKHYRAAVEADPGDSLLRFAVARSLLAGARNSEAQEQLKAIVLALPGDPLGTEAAGLLAVSLVEQGQFDDGLKVLDDCLARMEGQFLPSRVRLAFEDCVEKLFLFPRLRDHLRKAAADPKQTSLTALRVLAEMAKRVEDWDDAVATYGKAVQRYGTETFLVSELAGAQVAVADRQAEAAHMGTFGSRRYKEAVRNLERVSRADPSQPYFWQLHVALLDRWIQQYEAYKILKDKLARDPDDADTHVVKASVRPVEGFTKPKPVIQELERALALSWSPGPGRYEELLFARQLLANAYERDNRAADATYQLRTVLLSSPDPGTRVTLRQSAAKCFVRTHQYDELVALGRDLVRGSFAQDERLAYFQGIVGLSVADKDNGPALIAYLQQQLDPKTVDPALAQLVGEINLARRALPEAVRAYELACQANPKDAVAWIRLAEILTQVGQKDAALEPLRQAVEARPHEARFRRRTPSPWLKPIAPRKRSPRRRR